MGSFKQKRSRKPWDLDTLQCRMQDAMEALEPVFKGEEGKDFNKDSVQYKAKIAHAYSQLGSKVKQTIKVRKIEEVEAELEHLKKQIEEPQ